MTNENLVPQPTDEPAFGEAPPPARTLFSNKVYDRLKFVAQVVLPALATFYASFGALWEFPKTDQVVGSIIALDLLLGLILGLSTRQYESSGAKYSGAIFLGDRIAEDGETPLKEVGVSFKNHVDGQTLEKQKDVVFKVIQQ